MKNSCDIKVTTAGRGGGEMHTQKSSHCINSSLFSAALFSLSPFVEREKVQNGSKTLGICEDSDREDGQSSSLEKGRGGARIFFPAEFEGKNACLKKKWRQFA